VICEYGCNQEALYQFKNGKWCCSKSWNSCLVSRKKNSETAKEVKNRFEIRKRNSEIQKEVRKDPEKRIEISETAKEVWRNRTDEEKRKFSTKMSEVTKEVWKNKTDGEKAEHLSKIFKACERKPNDTELLVDDLVQTTKPKEFRYVGDFQVWIGGKNPDWININGKKQLIEFLGTYWHGEKVKRRTKQQEEEYLKSHYSKYGFDCLLIWEDELKDIQTLKQKISVF